jgi:hypothetical protein
LRFFTLSAGFIVALVGDKGVTTNATNTQNTIIGIMRLTSYVSGVFDRLITGVDSIQNALNDPAFTEFVPANVLQKDLI